MAFPAPDGFRFAAVCGGGSTVHLWDGGMTRMTACGLPGARSAGDFLKIRGHICERCSLKVTGHAVFLHRDFLLKLWDRAMGDPAVADITDRLLDFTEAFRAADPLDQKGFTAVIMADPVRWHLSRPAWRG